MVHVKNSIKSNNKNGNGMNYLCSIINYFFNLFINFLFIYFVSDKGGDRVAWTKQWIASPDIWTFRANFDSRVRKKNTTNMHS